MNWIYNDNLQYFHLDVSDYNQEGKYTLSIFNFYGTLVWSYDGKIKCYQSSKLVLSSPFADLTFENLKNKGYTNCIIEFCPHISKIKSLKKTLKNFIDKYGIKTHILIILNKPENILKILYDYFKPKYFFGIKSFYCGYRISKYHYYPWYRFSDFDAKLSKYLDFKLYEPEEILGSFIPPPFFYLLIDLVITCGQEYSGYELEYESIRNTIYVNEMECKISHTEGHKIYYIMNYNLVNDIIIRENEHYVVVGSNPTYMDRWKIYEKFKLESSYGTKRGITVNDVSYSVGWYTRSPYEESAKYKEYLRVFDHPEKNGEKWFRIN